MSVIVTIIWLQEKLLMNSLWVLNKKKEPMTNLKWILVTGHSTILKVITMNTLGINTYYFANSWELLWSLYEFFQNCLCCLGATPAEMYTGTLILMRRCPPDGEEYSNYGSYVQKLVVKKINDVVFCIRKTPNHEKKIIHIDQWRLTTIGNFFCSTHGYFQP